MNISKQKRLQIIPYYSYKKFSLKDWRSTGELLSGDKNQYYMCQKCISFPTNVPFCRIEQLVYIKQNKELIIYCHTVTMKVVHLYSSNLLMKNFYMSNKELFAAAFALKCSSTVTNIQYL